VDQAAIAHLLRPYAEVGARQLELTSIYTDILLKWNSRINLTAIREPEEIIRRHFGESFFAAVQLVTKDWHASVIDVGSGAGFPGIPIAMYSPGVALTLIESQGKKAAFLNEVIFALGLNQTKVFRGRAEEFAGSADLVTLRAVEKFSQVLPTAQSLVRAGGRLALMIGESQVSEAKILAKGVDWRDLVMVPGGNSRVLLAGTKLVNPRVS